MCFRDLNELFSDCFTKWSQLSFSYHPKNSIHSDDVVSHSAHTHKKNSINFLQDKTKNENSYQFESTKNLMNNVNNNDLNRNSYYSSRW